MNRQEVVFSTDFPSSAAAVVPEYFKPKTIEGMAPGEMAFPYDYAFVADGETRLMYVKTTADLVPDVAVPNYYGSQVGLMRVFEPVEGERCDGYIADFRRAKAHNITTSQLTISEDADEFTTKYVNDTIKDDGLVPLLGAIFPDPDGNPQYFGDERFREHAAVLMVEHNRLLAVGNPDAHDLPTLAAVPMVDPRMSDVPGNYLG